MPMPPQGVLGGTFDPIHYGHLRFAQDARTLLSLAEVRLVPAGAPPHRLAPAASAPDRMAMAVLAVEEFPGLIADDIEIRRGGPSYTVLTLFELRQQLGAIPLVLLLGSDAFAGLPSWYRWRELFDLAHLGVVVRPDATDLSRIPPELLAERARRFDSVASMEWRNSSAGRIIEIPIRPHAISATELRRRLANREAVGDLLPPKVLAYIERHRLYQDNP